LIKNASKLVLLLFLTLLFGLTACQERDYKLGQEIVIESSKTFTPKWVKKPPKKDLRHYYFVGQDTSFQRTDRYAYQVAVSEVSQFLNTRASKLYQRVEKSKNIDNVDILREEYIQNISQSTLTGVQKKDVYWEKVNRITDDGIKSFYRYYVLVSIRKKALKQSELRTIKDQIEKQSNEDIAKALNRLKERLKKQ
jgi:hypothetical protein